MFLKPQPTLLFPLITLIKWGLQPDFSEHVVFLRDTCMVLVLQELQQRLRAVTFNVKTVAHVSQLVPRMSSVLVNVGIVAHTANTAYHLANTLATGVLTMVASTTRKTVTKAA